MRKSMQSLPGSHATVARMGVHQQWLTATQKAQR